MDVLILPDDSVIKSIYYYGENNIKLDGDSNFKLLKKQMNAISILKKNQNYKLSEFNYFVNGDDLYIVYNTLYNTLAKLSNEELDILNHSDCYGIEKLEKFVELGILIPSDIDEIGSYITLSRDYSLYEKRRLNLVITTTMQCNARCSYCYEKGVLHQSFDINKTRELVDFVKKEVNELGVHITWFGGEPLLNTVLIDNVTEELINNNINFDSYIITNGSLLSEDIIFNKIPYWHVKGMQVTIDGTREKYMEIKNYVNTNQSVYDDLLSNITILATNDIKIDIRLNIDSENLFNIFELAKQLNCVFGSHNGVTVYPAFISGTESVIEDSLRVPIVKQLISCFTNPQIMGFASKMHSSPRIMPCNNANYRAFGIDVFGGLHRCEHYVGRPEYSIGSIANGLFDDDPRKEPYSLRNECLKCKFLPKCYGGCDAHYKQGDIPCMIEKYMIPAYLEYLVEFLE